MAFSEVSPPRALAEFQARFMQHAGGLIAPHHQSSVLLKVTAVRAGSVIVEGESGQPAPRDALACQPLTACAPVQAWRKAR
jgi:hypothetical protein